VGSEQYAEFDHVVIDVNQVGREGRREGRREERRV